MESIDYYVKKNQLKLEVRFDIISLLKEAGGFEIKHLKNTFYHFQRNFYLSNSIASRQRSPS